MQRDWKRGRRRRKERWRRGVACVVEVKPGTPVTGFTEYLGSDLFVQPGML